MEAALNQGRPFPFSRRWLNALALYCIAWQRYVLVQAVRHMIKKALKKILILDALIIAQYQRMTHHDIASFNTAATYAQALNLKDDKKALDLAVRNVQR